MVGHIFGNLSTAAYATLRTLTGLTTANTFSQAFLIVSARSFFSFSMSSSALSGLEFKLLTALTIEHICAVDNTSFVISEFDLIDCSMSYNFQVTFRFLWRESNPVLSVNVFLLRARPFTALSDIDTYFPLL